MSAAACARFALNDRLLSGAQEDGYEVQCRWCGVGGDLVGCDHCVSSYCELCMERNMGKKHLETVKKSEDWCCYSCEPGPTEALRWDTHERTVRRLPDFLPVAFYECCHSHASVETALGGGGDGASVDDGAANGGLR
jgi:hypothetical protein